MKIDVKNDTPRDILIALFNGKDEKLDVKRLTSNGVEVFNNLCADSYKVIFKDIDKYTESNPIILTYIVKIEGNKNLNP